MAEASICWGCPFMKYNRYGIGIEVVGQGEPSVIFVGYQPGTDERETARPLVGVFGTIVRSVAERYRNGKAYGLTNIIGCWSHDDAEEDNVRHAANLCGNDRFERELTKYPVANLVALGGEAVKYLLGPKTKISSVENSWQWSSRLNRWVLCVSAMVARSVFAFDAFHLGMKKAFTTPTPQVIPEVNYHVLTKDTIYKLEEVGYEGADIAVDIETTGLDFMKGKLTCVGIGQMMEGEPQVVIIPSSLLGDPRVRIHLLNVWAMDDLQIGFHNGGNFDLPWLMYHLGLPYRLDWDTILMHYERCEGGIGIMAGDAKDNISRGHGLKLLAWNYLGVGHYDDDIEYEPKTPEGWQRLYKYLSVDVWCTLKLRELFLKGD